MKFNVCGILPNAREALFKTPSPEKQGHHETLSMTREDHGNTTTKHNEIPYPGWGLGTEKRHPWKNRCKSNKVSNSVNNIVLMLVPSF